MHAHGLSIRVKESDDWIIDEYDDSTAQSLRAFYLDSLYDYVLIFFSLLLFVDNLEMDPELDSELGEAFAKKVAL